YILKLISREYGLGDPDSFVFNMSVGYDYDGIISEKIDSYIETMRNAENYPLWQEMQAWTLDHLDQFENIDEAYVKGISPKASESITLSTLHGCPPQEIERIASYLINEKGLNTFIKCNPTMLGYESARKILDDLGYTYMDFDDFHFTHDLQFKDAVPMIERLKVQAKDKNVDFGVKLTNTFPQKVTDGILPSEDMYMSGRSLFPCSIELAKRLSDQFDGDLKISFSGGADIHNIADIFSTGIWPITLATTLLKPGGYGRMKQMAESLDQVSYKDSEKLNAQAVRDLAENSKTNGNYVRGSVKKTPTRKIDKKVPLASCFTSPCSETCPISQNIPEYLRLLGEDKPLEALKVITDRNPLPFITGTICSHHCMDSCARNFYEGPVGIRSAKLEAAVRGIDDLMKEIAPAAPGTDKKTAVIGAGPAGISAAAFLARNGVPVTVFERKEEAGGIVKYVIPDFRIEDKTIAGDLKMLEAMGVDMRMGAEVASVQDLKDQGYDSVIIATGTWAPSPYKLDGDQPVNVLEFLEAFNHIEEKPFDLGEKVVVIGGGNTAMDAARAAKRVPGVKDVTIAYRRTVREMPAEEEELQLALEDGVKFMDLLSPETFKDGKLACRVMELGEPDESGRRRPVGTDHFEYIDANTVIASVGSKADTAWLEQNGVEVDQRGRVVKNPQTLEVGEGIYIAGDVSHGASDVVHAIADARTAADEIMNRLGITPVTLNEADTGDAARALGKRGILKNSTAGEPEADRCLECSTICEACTDVCPNRANIAITVPGVKMPQIIHVDRMCNECGNCIIFCPYDSAPYKDKFTMFHTMDDVNESENSGFLITDDGATVRINGEVFTVGKDLNDYRLPKELAGVIKAVRDDYGYLL
ncbi:MAG: putative selenate reductase subunit YgfK, partial [Eubacteriaceae bacterium]